MATIKAAKGKALTEAYQKALHWFFSFPNREIGLNELQEQLSISKATANRVVTQLVKEGFLTKQELGKLWRISSAPNHLYTHSRKISAALTAIYESDIIQEIYKRIESPRSIVLFGSYRKGDDTEESDIDIAVEILGNDELRIERLGILSAYLYRKNIPVNIHLFSRNKIDLNLFANIANGIVLQGFLETRP
jgi:predicted nucleotidyltransferase